MKKVYMIGGTMGVGKTAVCQRLKSDLPQSIFLDGDWCWNSNPFQVTEETKSMVLDNICYLLNNFIHCSTYENIIFCWVMHEQFIIDTILGKLDMSNCNVRCISLVADEETIRNRLMTDISNEIRTVDVVERSIAKIPLYSKLNTLKIDTNKKTVKEISNEILKL